MIRKLLLLLIVSASCGTAKADLFYSIDIDTDELVTMESSTGEVQVVGSLGRNINRQDISLAMFDGKLFGVLGHFDLRRADLFEIDRESGQMTFLAQLVDNGTEATLAEGLVATPTGLRVAYTTRSGGGFISPMLGDLALNGQITGGFDTGIDIDAVALQPNGRLFAVDSRSNNGVFSFNLEPTEAIGSYNVSNTGPGDIDYLDGSIWGISPAGIVEIDPNDGSLSSLTPLSRSGTYNGFTAAVPEPSTFVLCAVALGLYFLFRRRKSNRFDTA